MTHPLAALIAGVKVKPLEWSQRDGIWTARTAFGTSYDVCDSEWCYVPRHVWHWEDNDDAARFHRHTAGTHRARKCGGADCDLSIRDDVMIWNFNIDDAPRGHFEDVTRTIGKNEVTQRVHVPEPIIAAGNDGVVTVSRWIDKDQRWNMFTKDVPPIAWMPWPKHPEAEQ